MQVTRYDKIVNGELRDDLQILHEDEKCMAFRDEEQIGTKNFLVIPKFRQGLSSISKATSDHEALLGYLMVVAAKVAKLQGLDKKKGYRLMVNEGDEEGQNIGHFHILVISNEEQDK